MKNKIHRQLRNYHAQFTELNSQYETSNFCSLCLQNPHMLSKVTAAKLVRMVHLEVRKLLFKTQIKTPQKSKKAVLLLHSSNTACKTKISNKSQNHLVWKRPKIMSPTINQHCQVTTKPRMPQKSDIYGNVASMHLLSAASTFPQAACISDWSLHSREWETDPPLPVCSSCRVKSFKLASARETPERQDAELYKMLIYVIAFWRNTGGRAAKTQKDKGLFWN